jgi:hypothetical protein
MVLIALGVGALVWLGQRAVRSLYLEPRAELQGRIDSRRAYVAAAAAERPLHVRVQRELESFAARTMGGTAERVNHELRHRLNRIGAATGLADLTVNTPRQAARLTPARAQLRAPQERALREEVDFVEIEGLISGTGSFEQVLRLIHRIERAPWIKRIDDVRIDPKGEGYAVVVRLTTMFLPGADPAPLPESVDDEASFAPYLALVSGNPFALAAPEAPVVEVAAPQAPAAFPYGQWIVTGVVEGPAGPEVWLRHRGNARTTCLRAGDRVGETVLSAVRGDTALFAEGAERFEVTVGQSLADRLRVP